MSNALLGVVADLVRNIYVGMGRTVPPQRSRTLGRLRWWPVLLCLSMLAAESGVAQSPSAAGVGLDLDVPDAYVLAGLKANELLGLDRYAEVDAELDNALESGARMPDGQWRYRQIYSGLTGHFGRQPSWDWPLRRLERWMKARPDSIHAPVLLASYWISYAWHARGSGYASTVPTESWPLFRERLAKALSALEAARPLRSRNPMWYSNMITVTRALGWPKQEIRALFDEAVTQSPYFYTHYLDYSASLTPQWGGSVEQYTEFAKEAVLRTSQQDGKSMYARLYWSYAEYSGDDAAFDSLEIPWPEMRAGFEDLIARYPSKWNINNYARFACKARDGRTFQTLLPRVEAGVLWDAWGRPYALDTCKEFFLKRT